MAQYEKDDSRKRTAMLVSVGLHAGVLLLFFFLLAWRAPDPPLPEYGIELNFGTDAVGSGDVQSTAPANNAPKVEDAKPNPPAAEPKPAEPEPEPEPVPVAPGSVAEPEPMVTQDEPSPAVVEKKEPKKEKPVEKKEPEKKPEPKVEEKPKVVEKPKEPAPKPVDQNALMGPKPKETGAGGKSGASNKPSGNNNGDDAGKVGDKGSPEGSIDAKALYGKPGTGGGGGGKGASISVTGWTWDAKPSVDDKSAENGRIVFQIRVDDQGQIVTATTKESTVSPAVVALYKKAIEGLYLRQTSNNEPAPISVGTVVFVIESK